MRLDPIKHQIASEIKKTENARKVSTDSKIRSHTPKADSLSFSSDARQLNETNADSDIVKTQLSVETDIRPDKIAEVRKKMEDGYYNSPEFIEKLATKLLKEFGIEK